MYEIYLYYIGIFDIILLCTSKLSKNNYKSKNKKCRINAVLLIFSMRLSEMC